MTGLSEADIATLLTPCACGHTINDHGELAGCWTCGDIEGATDYCPVSFESMLTAAVEAIVRRRVAVVLTEAAQELRKLAVIEFDQRGLRDVRGAGIWDSASWLSERAGISD